MRNATIITLTVCLCMFSAHVTSAQQMPAPRPERTLAEEAQRLMEVTGALKLARQMASMTANQMLKATQAANPQIPARAGAIITEITNAEFDQAFAPGGEMAAGIAEVYARHFTVDELREMIAFYESPIGRKVTESLPVVAQESMQVGMGWALKRMPEVQRKIQERLKAEGLIKY
ncbi:MAG: DUF2059 domain-containing protein [Acidobacteria bacterium]|nr:DUF2059 domain-containing protein [Acidobacteriota bacterium]